MIGLIKGYDVSIIMPDKFGKDKHIVTLLPDGAERYFSTGLFRKS